MSDMLPEQFKAPLTSSSKDDSGKDMLYSLCLAYFPRALAEVAKVSKFGLEKYGAQPEDKGFLKIPNGWRRFTDALVRHLKDELKETYNPVDGNMRHDAQVAWNALARLEMALIEGETAVQPGTDIEQTIVNYDIQRDQYLLSDGTYIGRDDVNTEETGPTWPSIRGTFRCRH
jgi:hypothetical protein